jgi:hypothetical protein
MFGEPRCYIRAEILDVHQVASVRSYLTARTAAMAELGFIDAAHRLGLSRFDAADKTLGIGTGGPRCVPSGGETAIDHEIGTGCKAGTIR